MPKLCDLLHWGFATLLVLLSVAGPASAERPVLFEVAQRPSIRDASTLAATQTPLGTRFAHGRPCRLYSVTFYSHTYGPGSTVRIFAYYASPRDIGAPVPGLVMIHGGGGYALQRRALDAAGQGYAALAIDLPGKGEGRSRSRSTGPDLSVANLFSSSPRPEDNYLYHAVTAAMRSITYLGARPEVDKSRIGIYGISWGGVVSLITGSVDDRVAAVMDMFGSGYLFHGSTWTERLEAMSPEARERWRYNFDASSYVRAMTCPILGLTGTNDNCYWLPSFMRTLRSMSNKRWLLLRPNLDHRIDEVARRALWAWLGKHLKYEAPSAPRVGWWATKLEGDEVLASTTASGDQAVVSARITYSRGSGGWARRRWQTMRCDRLPGRFIARLPLTPQPLFAYASFFFEDGAVLSSSVRTLASVDVGNQIVLYDLPVICDGKLLAPAEEFLPKLGAEIVPELSTSRTLGAITSAGLKPIPCLTVGDERYVEVRPAAGALGAIVHWDGRMIHIYWKGSGPKPVDVFEMNYPTFHVGNPEKGTTGSKALTAGNEE